MRQLLEFLSKNIHWLVFLLLETASVVLLFRYNSYQGSVWFSTANSVSGKVYEWNSEVTKFFSLSDINKQLTQRNTQLELEMSKLRQELLDLSKDSTVVLAKNPVIDCKTIPAKVVQSSLNKKNNLITLDKGTADGVQVDMGVVCGNGVVGIVYLAGTHYSVVIPIVSSNSNISSSIRRRGYFGNLRWSGDDPQSAYVEDIPRHAHVVKGDYVETSGYSAVFPQGITIGKVTKVTNSPDGMAYRLKIQLATDFSNLRDVCIIDNSKAKEQVEVLRAAQDSIAVKEK